MKWVRMVGFMSTQSEIHEEIMCKQLIQFAREFYENPSNMQAFKKWRKEVKNREEKITGRRNV